MPMLKIPARVRMPAVPIDYQRVNQVIHSYLWVGTANVHQWACKDDMILVGTYLIWWDTMAYWEIILQGGVCGYSLYLHELMEVDWYFRRDADPLNAKEQASGYRAAHAEGLLYEHRFLQVVARTMGYAFSLRELIIYNPHGDPPKDDWEGDWNVLLAQKHQDLSPTDHALRPEVEDDVRAFYTGLGFQGV